MKKEKILLITDVLPCKNYSGGIMSLQLVKFLLEEKYDVYCCCIRSENIEEVIDEDIIRDINFLVINKPKEEPKASLNYQLKIKLISKKVRDYIKNNKIDKIWCPLQGETLIKVLYDVTQRVKIPYITQTWDPIEWMLDDRKYSNERKNEVLSIYEKLLVNASFCFTASSNMTKVYKKEYNKNAIELYTYMDINRYKDFYLDKNKKEFVIVLAGQMYSVNQIKILLDAIVNLNWKYNGKKIIFKYFGNDKPKVFTSKKYQNIIWAGYVTQEKLIEEMNKANLLYCPYFFDTEGTFAKIAFQSFPSKVVTYLTANTPILVHAPSSSSIYSFFDKKRAAYLLDSMNVDEVTDYLKRVISNAEDEEITIKKNSRSLFEHNFLPEIMKKRFFDGLSLSYSKDKKLRILEVNYVDLPGRRFNGFDILETINNNTKHRAKQIVTYKTSENKDVYEYYINPIEQNMEYRFLDFENRELSLHSTLSLTSGALEHSDVFNNADIVHYHMIHNAKFSLYSLIKLCNQKKSVWTIHDPWTFTGRCVHYGKCGKWKTGCKNCKYLETLFPLKEDNCNALWKIKKYVYSKINPDIIVTSKYMLDLLKTSPLTQHFNHVHLIPLGVDLNYFNDKISKKEACKKLGINHNDFVIFLRAQDAFKGTEYVLEALKKLDAKQKITVVTCSQKNLLDEVKDKYKIVDLGNIGNDLMLNAYSACDIFLMPSIGESFGLMAVEAMACSKPVVVFDNTALPTVTFAPECGVLVENQNAEKLKDAIEMLLDNPKERIKRGKLGRKLAEENYDINKNEEKTIAVYEELWNRQEKLKENPIVKVNYNSEQSVAIMNKLNILTKSLYSKKSKEFQELIYDNLPFNKKVEIDYSNLDVQEIINLYNDKSFNLIRKRSSIINAKYNSKKNMLTTTREIIYFTFKDRGELKAVVSNKLHNHPRVLKTLVAFYGVLKTLKRKVLRKKNGKAKS